MSTATNGQTSASVTRLGGFEIIRKLGQGGMGAVFLARQVSVDRQVALKVLPQRFARSKDFVERFLREARAAAKLHHPNIVQAIDVGFDGGYYYFAMEYVEGQNLRQKLDHDGSLPEALALEISRQMARALDSAHSQAQIIHRDIKPENILLAPDGTPKLTDLGLAREVIRSDSSITQAGTAMGTPNYIAPEQVRGETDLDGRVDIYSLGATLFHLLTGEPPYKGGTNAEVMAKHLSEPVPDPRTVNRAVSPPAAAIVRKAMAKDRQARYLNARVMAEDIDLVLAGKAPAIARVTAAPVAAARPARPASRRPVRRTFPLGSLAALLIIGALAVGGWFAFGPTGNQRATPTPPPTDNVADETPIDPAARNLVPSVPKETTQAGRSTSRTDPDGELRKAAEAALAQMLKDARDLADADDYDAALAVFTQIPDSFVRFIAVGVKRATDGFHTEAAGRINPVLTEAERLLKAGEPQKGLTELAKVEDIKYAPLAARIRELHDQLAAEVKRLEDEAQARALAAAKPSARDLLAKNAELQKTYLAKCDEMKKAEYDALQKQYGDDWTKINDDIEDLEDRIADAEEQIRLARLAASRNDGDHKDPPPRLPRIRPPRRPRGGRVMPAPPVETLAKDRTDLEALKLKRAKLATFIMQEKAKISRRYQTRVERVKLAFMHFQDAMVRGGDGVTLEKIVAAFEAALKVE